MKGNSPSNSVNGLWSTLARVVKCNGLTLLSLFLYAIGDAFKVGANQVLPIIIPFVCNTRRFGCIWLIQYEVMVGSLSIQLLFISCIVVYEVESYLLYLHKRGV